MEFVAKRYAPKLLTLKGQVLVVLARQSVQPAR